MLPRRRTDRERGRICWSGSATQTIQKLCPKPKGCGETKPISDFYDRPNTYCKPCYSAIKKARYNVKREQYIAKNIEWQKNNPDKVRAAQQRFNATPERKAYLQQLEQQPHVQTTRQQYRETHRAEKRAAQAIYNAEHREEKNRKSRERYQANKQSIAEYHRVHREENIEEYRAREKRWKLEHPDQVRLHTNLRRARIKGLEGSYTLTELEALYDKYDRTCLWCRRREPEITLSPDHVVAITRQGATNWIKNIQPLCAGVGGCNFRKGNRNFDFRPYWPGPVPEQPSFE